MAAPALPRQAISQPPHSAGRRFQGLRSLVDPSQIPSAVTHYANDQRRWDNKTYTTIMTDIELPLAPTEVTIVDRGNSSPRLFRLSTYHIPNTHDLASTCGIPLGFILQPFAELSPEEEAVPYADFESEPPRCSQCGGYINPWVLWSPSGQKWTCNLCRHSNEVPDWYYCPMDQFGRRTDHASRPELNCGTVDIPVPSKYFANQPQPRLIPSYAALPDAPSHPLKNPEVRLPVRLRSLFLIDVSATSVSSGVLVSVCDAIRETLYGGEPNDPSVIPRTSTPFGEVAIMTFDGALQYYALSPSQQQPSIYVVADVDEVFTPAREGLFADPDDARDVIERLLGLIPRLYSSAPSSSSALCAGIQGALATLARSGGQILAFQTVLPNYGPGLLPPRSDSELYGTQKEKTLWEPQELVWKDLAEELAETGVAVHLWLFPDRWIDVGSIDTVASVTGGDLFFHPRFNRPRDYHLLLSEIHRVIHRQSGYDCSIRVRCSDGLQVSEYLSQLYQPAPDSLTAGVVSADHSISGLIAVTGGTIDDRQDAYFQAAILYTSADGQRRVRVCNVGVRPSTLAGNVFKFADQEVGISLMAKQAILAMTSKSISDIKDSLSQRYVDLLVGYRRNCAASTAPTQLILPESYKLLPAIGNAILKTQALKGGIVSSDSRNVSRHRILTMGVVPLLNYLYPRIIPIHDLSPTAAFPDPSTGKLIVPTPIPASHLWMQPDGAYIADNGEVTILWLGASVSPQILLDLFEVEDLHQIGPGINQLPVLPTTLSTQVRNLIKHEEMRRGGRTIPFVIARQNMDGSELEFGNMLIEDQNNDAMSYVDYLCHLHRQISQELTKPMSWNPF